jgi:hypothetical protein
VLFVVSSAVFLSVNSFLVTVEFGSSFRLLSRNFSFRHGGGDDDRGGGSGSCWKREKEGEECWISHVGTCNGLVLRGCLLGPCCDTQNVSDKLVQGECQDCVRRKLVQRGTYHIRSKSTLMECISRSSSSSIVTRVASQSLFFAQISTKKRGKYALLIKLRA